MVADPAERHRDVGVDAGPLLVRAALAPADHANLGYNYLVKISSTIFKLSYHGFHLLPGPGLRVPHHEGAPAVAEACVWLVFGMVRFLAELVSRICLILDLLCYSSVCGR